MNQVTFDTGALSALERRDKRMLTYMGRLLAKPTEIVVPAPVLAQYWRADPRQAPVAQVLKRNEFVVVWMSEGIAKAVGKLCKETDTADIVDASVVYSARKAGHKTVVTSDPDDIAALDPKLNLIVV